MCQDQRHPERAGDARIIEQDAHPDVQNVDTVSLHHHIKSEEWNIHEEQGNREAEAKPERSSNCVRHCPRIIPITHIPMVVIKHFHNWRISLSPILEVCCMMRLASSQFMKPPPAARSESPTRNPSHIAEADEKSSALLSTIRPLATSATCSIPQD
jgi:hypothetical protein